MHTYRTGRLAVDLADVLTALHVSGPLTLAGHSMGGMTALEYLGRSAADRPVEPSGLVLIATAAGKLAERGIGRLISTPATEALFEIVDRAPRFATEWAVKAVARALSDVLLAIPGLDPSARAGLAALPTNSLTTAAGFLVGLKRYDRYDTLASITATTVVVSGGRDYATPVSHANDLAATIHRCGAHAPSVRRPHAASGGIACCQRRHRPCDGRNTLREGRTRGRVERACAGRCRPSRCGSLPCSSRRSPSSQVYFSRSRSSSPATDCAT